jgi:hypothetical protein
MQPIHHNDVFNTRLLRLLGYATLFAQLILSLSFYQERTLFTDIPYQTVLMINEGAVQVQVFRFGAAIVQLLPLLAIKLQLSIETILQAYSLSFPLLYLLLYFLMVEVFKSPKLGWAMIFLFTLIIFDGFYWPSSEQQQGLAFLLLFFAMVLRFPALKERWLWPVLLFGIVAIAYYHPLIFIPFYFLLAFFWLSKKELRHPRTIYLGIAMALVLVIKSQWSSNYYDDAKYSVFLDNLIEFFPNYFAFPSHQKFLSNAIKFWYMLPVLFLVVEGYYLWHKKWWKALLVAGFCMGTILLLHIGSPKASYRFYAEVNYMPLVLFLAVPFLFDIVPSLRSQRLTFVLFLGLMALRLNTIYQNHKPYTQRIDWLEQTIDTYSTRQQANRLWLYQTEVPMHTLIMTWSTAYETLLLTAIDGPDAAKTLSIFSEVGAQRQNQLQQDSFFVSEIRVHPIEEFNKAYFNLGQSSYQKITY